MTVAAPLKDMRSSWCELFEQAFREGFEEGFREGFKEGWQEGRLEKGAQTLLKLLRLKFRKLPAGTIARVRGASEQERDCWTDRVLTASTLTEVLEG